MTVKLAVCQEPPKLTVHKGAYRNIANIPSAIQAVKVVWRYMKNNRPPSTFSVHNRISEQSWQYNIACMGRERCVGMGVGSGGGEGCVHHSHTVDAQSTRFMVIKIRVADII